MNEQKKKNHFHFWIRFFSVIIIIIITQLGRVWFIFRNNSFFFFIYRCLKFFRVNRSTFQNQIKTMKQGKERKKIFVEPANSIEHIFISINISGATTIHIYTHTHIHIHIHNLCVSFARLSLWLPEYRVQIGQLCVFPDFMCYIINFELTLIPNRYAILILFSLLFLFFFRLFCLCIAGTIH